MKYLGNDLNITERRFYEKTSDFNRFKDLTKNDVTEIDSDIKIRLEKPYQPNVSTYAAILEFLTNPVIGKIYKTFDERVLFLIRAVDPSLKALTTYLNTTIPSLEAADQLPPRQKKAYLENRQSILNTMQSQVREQIGFYNNRIINYEAAFFMRFAKSDTFSPTDNQHFITELFSYITPNFTFDSLTTEEHEQLSNKITWYQIEAQDNISPTKTAFHILKQNSLLKLSSLEEKIAFYIMVIDPNLNLLRIFEEESKIPEVKKRAITELGFYNQNLILAEKAYHKRFSPEEKLSIWTI